MFHWEKLGRVFNPIDLPKESWMKEYAQSPTIVAFDNHVRVFFCSRPGLDPDGQYRSYLAYIDLKRNDLMKIVRICKQPLLNLGELGTFDEFGTNPASVISFGNEIRVYYAGWTRCESVPFNGAIGMAISNNNGETFSRLGPGPVLSYSLDEPFVIGSPRIKRFDNKWYLTYSSGREWINYKNRPEPVYKIRMAVSEDGINWSKIGKDLVEDKIDTNECQASPDIFFKDGIYHMFFSYRHNADFKNKAKGYRIGYAFSKDLFNWRRDDSVVGISVSEFGWDSEMVSYPHVFDIDNNIFMLYQGNTFGREGFGLCRLSKIVNSQ